jgi:hypothetical protein
LDIIKFDSAKKSWETKHHKLVYNYRSIQEDKMVSKQQYPLLLFNNMVYLHENKLFVLSNNKQDFEPLVLSYKKVKELIKDSSNKNTLKLYEFNIVEP